MFVDDVSASAEDSAHPCHTCTCLCSVQGLLPGAIGGWVVAGICLILAIMFMVWVSFMGSSPVTLVSWFFPAFASSADAARLSIGVVLHPMGLGSAWRATLSDRYSG